MIEIIQPYNCIGWIEGLTINGVCVRKHKDPGYVPVSSRAGKMMGCGREVPIQ